MTGKQALMIILIMFLFTVGFSYYLSNRYDNSEIDDFCYGLMNDWMGDEKLSYLHPYIKKAMSDNKITQEERSKIFEVHDSHKDHNRKKNMLSETLTE